MTENKRFTFTKNSVAKNIKTPICDYHGEILTIGEVLDRMNTLTEENEQLKNTLSNYMDDIEKLIIENEQLKQRVTVLSDEITAQGIVIEGYQDRNLKLFEEKEQLKSELKGLRKKYNDFSETVDKRLKELNLND